jgi:hypothetical protein
MIKLPLGLFRWQTIKKVRQLHPMTHDRIGFPVPEMFSDIKAIVGMVETVKGFGTRTHSPWN